MAINPAAATTILASLQDVASKLNAVIGTAPTAPAIAAPATGFAQPPAAPVNLLGGGQPLDAGAALQSLGQVLQQVVQLLGSFTGKAPAAAAAGAPAQQNVQAPAGTAQPAAAATAAPAPAGVAPAAAAPGGAPAQNLGTPAAAPAPAAQAAAPAGPGKLNLTPDEVAAIKAAPSQQAASQIVKQAMQRQAGGGNAALAAAGGKKGKKGGGGAQGIINGVLGTSVKRGRKKDKASSAFLEQMCNDVAGKVRSGQTTPTAGSSTSSAVAQPASGTPYNGSSSSGTPFSDSSAPNSSSPNLSSGPLSSGPQTVDLSPYNPQANKIAEMGSPLIFDLTGAGHVIREAEMVPVDLDGDGRIEVVTDLASGTGLLVFDPRLAADDARTHALGAEMFGSGTDLSAYGIKAKTDDGTFENGFDALRAVAEKFGLVSPDKQHLDARDLAFLESAIGLRMRVGGIFGDDIRIADSGITHIALGSSGMTQSLQTAMSDAFGNKYMRQGGAVFTIRGERREYVDIFFRIQARVTLDEDLARFAAAA